MPAPAHSTFTFSLPSGVAVDVVVTSFSNRLHIVVSATGKLGSMLEVTKQVADHGPPSGMAGETPGDTWNVRTLLGRRDDMEAVIARRIGEQLDDERPLLLMLALPPSKETPELADMRAVVAGVVKAIKGE